ncbi:PREDICTED: alpha-2-macroglobulin-like [Nanorana parkeri]|uniref:alpha-2-macroglobulin-like n=1 Tax=Nanorana parkeri TaxID=125878 RepID=UPI0008542D91|nr:PREDICTED: alpha-2-macroglobulin-like [Nanorana parkeri]
MRYQAEDVIVVKELARHYAVIFPSEFRSDHPEKVCIQLEGAQGETRVEISLNLDKENTTLAEKTFKDSTFTCIQLQVKSPSEGNEEQDVVGTLVAEIENAGETITKSAKVLLKKSKSGLLIQTDKAVYKPGQQVLFRILAINEDYQPEERMFPVVELQDPGKNRIGQWLNVNLNQGIKEFSFSLSSEPPLGEYTIRVGDKVQTFSVEEYVLPKFEVILGLPKFTRIDSKSLSFPVCGKYTHGKPVQGKFTVGICRNYYQWHTRNIEKKPDICFGFIGELDKSGCQTIELNIEAFKLNSTGMDYQLKVEASITEQGTEIQLSTSSQTTVSNVINKLSYVDPDYSYKAGIPYHVVVKVTDVNDNPQQGMKVYFHSRDGREEKLIDTSVTDDNGKAVFILNTNDWEGTKYFMAKTMLKNPDLVVGYIRPDYGQVHLSIYPFYSKSKSFLKLHSLEKVLPCGGQQEVQVEYIIKHTELKKEYEHLDLHYLVTYMGSIVDTGSLEINVKNGNEDLHGKATFNLPVSGGKSSTLRALAYILLPDGEILADSAKYNMQKCFKNQVSFGFSPDEVLPGSDVSIKVQAAPGSLCGLRVVDKSVVLMKPDKELTADKVFDLFPYWEFEDYDYRVQDHDNPCVSPDFISSPFLRRPGPIVRPWFPRFPKGDVDVNTLFKGLRLKILTSAEIKKCVETPAIDDRVGSTVLLARVPSAPHETNLLTTARTAKKEEERIRVYFPETLLFELIALGTDGSAELHKKAPDTITDWNGGAVCLGPSGLGLSSAASLRVFQPFFVELTLPYSVVRGETFTLKASTFNYMEQPMKIRTTLHTTSDLEKMPCEDCHHTSCLGADESTTFFWKLKAKVLGQVNITVKTEALHTDELCNNEIPIVPKRGSTDTIVKPLLVQPGGVLEEKSFSSLMCIQEGKDNSKTEDVNLKVPEKVLENSERAHITVLGDLMGTAMQNLDRLLAMPYGCGEQNMVLFAPNIFILQYLQNTHQLTDEIKSKAIRFLESGSRETVLHSRGFSKYAPTAYLLNLLSAFVVKSYSKSRPYIFIDTSHLNDSVNWLKNHRNESGCFRSMGRLFNNAMKGGVEDDTSLSAYVTIALLEHGLSHEDPLVRDAVTCLRKEAVKVTNVYTLALMAYTFTLYGDNELRKDLLKRLEEKAVIGDGQIHWKRDSTPPKQDSYWYRAPSAEVEMTAYVLMTVLDGPEPDLGKAAKIVNWISKQQNAYGGFSSTQDTVVALQALAKYAEITYSDKGDITVTVTSKTGFLEEFHVDKNNRLLLQRATLPAIPGDYTVTATGSGCVFVQAVLRYNIPPPKTEAVFSLSVRTSSRMECLGKTVKSFEIGILAAYTGSRKISNMAVLEVKMLSGFIPVKSTVRQLEKDKVIKRSDIQVDKVILYFDHLDQQLKHLTFMVEQDVEVKDLKPAAVEVYDYYETDDRVSVDYNHPCTVIMGIKDSKPAFTWS